MATPVSERVQKRREALRQSGLRPIQLWVPDTRQPAFAEECRRQSLLLKNDSAETEALQWMDQAADDQGWRE
jgi:hypothetical protein